MPSPKRRAGFWLAAGIFGLLAAKILQGIVANSILEQRFVRWRSDRTIASGLSKGRAITAALCYAAIVVPTLLRFSAPQQWKSLAIFPAPQNWRTAASTGLSEWTDAIRDGGEHLFDAVAFGMNGLLDGLETLLAGAPWPAMIVFVGLLAWRAAGPRIAVLAAASLAYLGVLGFWQQAMATMALLGTAACISISLGIPFGILCARRPRLYAAVRPVLDFMQTMPSFVYLIPVIAFFGTGKAAAVVVTLIFGSPPVIRLTVLGLRNVPAHVREAATAFGATPSYLLLRVDLPLAADTIMTGVNQTISLSLAMVVVASLIGAKGLGEVVLDGTVLRGDGRGNLGGIRHFVLRDAAGQNCPRRAATAAEKVIDSNPGFLQMNNENLPTATAAPRSVVAGEAAWLNFNAGRPSGLGGGRRAGDGAHRGIGRDRPTCAGSAQVGRERTGIWRKDGRHRFCFRRNCGATGRPQPAFGIFALDGISVIDGTGGAAGAQIRIPNRRLPRRSGTNLARRRRRHLRHDATDGGRTTPAGTAGRTARRDSHSARNGARLCDDGGRVCANH